MLTDEDIQQRIHAIGMRLAEARDKRALDQQDLTRRSGVSRVMISDFERAARTMSVEHLFRLANGAGVNPDWLLTGIGEMLADGPTLGQIRDEAWRARSQEYNFIAVVDNMLRRYRQDKKLMTWALGACLRAFWGTPWLGFDDLREVAQIVETVSDRCGLDLIEVLEATGHATASQYIADWLLHRGIDPEAFGPECQNDDLSYEVCYHPELAKSPAELMEMAKKKGLIKSSALSSSVGQALNYFLGFLRIFDPQGRKG